MPNTRSAKKKARRDERRREHNRYYKKTTLNFVRQLLKTTDIKELEEKINRAYKMLDKLGSRYIIHPNRAARLKSKLAIHFNNVKKHHTSGSSHT